MGARLSQCFVKGGGAVEDEPVSAKSVKPAAVVAEPVSGALQSPKLINSQPPSSEEPVEVFAVDASLCEPEPEEDSFVLLAPTAPAECAAVEELEQVADAEWMHTASAEPTAVEEPEEVADAEWVHLEHKDAAPEVEAMHEKSVQQPEANDVEPMHEKSFQQPEATEIEPPEPIVSLPAEEKTNDVETEATEVEPPGPIVSLPAEEKANDVDTDFAATEETQAEEDEANEEDEDLEDIEVQHAERGALVKILDSFTTSLPQESNRRLFGQPQPVTLREGQEGRLKAVRPDGCFMVNFYDGDAWVNDCKTCLLTRDEIGDPALVHLRQVGIGDRIRWYGWA